MSFFEVFFPLSNLGNVLLQCCAELGREISSQGCCMCNLHSHGNILPLHYPQEQPQWIFPWICCEGHEWTQTDLRDQLRSHSFLVVISHCFHAFSRCNPHCSESPPKLFYLSPLVGANVPQGCSSPGAEEQGPVRPPAPLHLCHQGLEQSCDHSSAAGPSLPTKTLQTAVMAANDDVSVWNQEENKIKKIRKKRQENYFFLILGF